MKVTPISTTSVRLCAVKIDIQNTNVLIINVYMPVFSENVSNINEFSAILTEISAIINSHDNYQIIIGGDFNLDFYRDQNSILYSNILDFLCNESLLSDVETFNVNNDCFTYLSCNNTKSKIDHFLFSDNSLEYCGNFKILYDGSNLSDHNPISIDFTIDTKYEYIDGNNINSGDNTTFDWKAATDDNRKLYVNILNELLSTIYLPQSVVHCKNMSCLGHREQILEYLDCIIDAMQVATAISIPVRSNKLKSNSVPGWNKYVRHYKNQSIFWCKIWKECGSPETGNLAEIRRYVKRKYHLAVKYVYNHRDEIIKEKVANSLKSKQNNNFWAEINKIRTNVNNITNVMDDVIGEVEISKVLKNKYQTLYNEFDECNSNILVELNDKIKNICCKNVCNIDHEVKLSDIKIAVLGLINNKYDPIFEISSNNIKCSSDVLLNRLCQLFNAILLHGVSSSKINRSYITSLIKDKRKPSYDSNNYRGISLSTSIAKLFEVIILNKIKKFIISDECQFGFKEKHSTGLSASILSQTIKYYLENDSTVYALFLDASKAFDRVKHSKLFYELINRNVCPLYLRLMFVMYSLNNASVKWVNVITESFYLQNGVKQGSNLSPYLFACYLDPLIRDIRSSRVGCHMGNIPCNIISYADDVALLSPTLQGLKHIIKICESYGIQYQVQFNPDKSKIMIFSNNRINNNINVKLNDKCVEVVSNLKYLGFDLQNSVDIFNMKKTANEIKVRANIICKEFKNINTDAKIQLFNSQCLSLYGSPLWNICSKNIKELEVAWRKSCRMILNLNPRTHNVLIPKLMGTNDIKTVVDERFINFIIRGLSHNNTLISNVFKNSLYSDSSFFVRNLNSVLRSHGLKNDVIFQTRKVKLKSCTDFDWKIKLLNELIYLRDFKVYDFLSKEQVKVLIDHLCID